MCAPVIEKDGVPFQTNISGKYRKCEESNCENYISCPYVRCPEHWSAISNARSEVHVYGQ